MNSFAKKLIESYKRIDVEVFIDDANVFHSQKENNIWIDWQKFQTLLKKHFNLKLIKYYRGKFPDNLPQSAQVTSKNKSFTDKLKKLNFEVVERDLKKIYIDESKTKFIYKCDFDGEIGFDIAKHHQPQNLVIIVSGDSDFVFLKYKKVNCLFICFDHKAPWEIRRSRHIFFEEIIDEIKKTPRKRGEHYKNIIT